MPGVVVDRARGALLHGESRGTTGDRLAREERTGLEGMRGTRWAGGAQCAVLRLSFCGARAVACKRRRVFKLPFISIELGKFSSSSLPLFKSCCLGHSADTEAGLRFGPGWQTLLPRLVAGLGRAPGLAVRCGCVALGWGRCSAPCWGTPGPPCLRAWERVVLARPAPRWVALVSSRGENCQCVPRRAARDDFPFFNFRNVCCGRRFEASQDSQERGVPLFPLLT